MKPEPKGAPRRTVLTIEGESFLFNGRPTCEGRVWRGFPVEGLLFNARMVQGIFDDLNPETSGRWAYPDTGGWDPERNTREFVAAMPDWHRHGLRCVVVNLQGGSPLGYSRDQPWHNSAIRPDGTLRPNYMRRLAAVLDRADALGMAVMLGLFYFGQDHRFADDAAVERACDAAVDWLVARGDRHVLIEIANECDNRYVRPPIQAPRIHALIERVQRRSASAGLPLAVSASFCGGRLPTPEVVRASDFVLLHGNGVRDPAAMVALVRAARAMVERPPKPILVNEDDVPWREPSQGFGPTGNNFVAAVENRASWGYFDFRREGEGFDEGYQSVPVNWRISSARKRAFFDRLADIAGVGRTL